ncbi:MAG: DUF4037 domain-containing protein [Anaerolineaceae bacterium]|nr:DUF4037 domain-containing protein [Anaerolineaceae bacterium]
MSDNAQLVLARQLSGLFACFPQVEAIALSGSLTSGAAFDPASDIDLYVFTTAPVPLEQRLNLVESAGGASLANMNLDYWDVGDEWFHKPSGIEVDVIYWDMGWMEAILARVLKQHQASAGYSTCHWQTIRNAQILFDRSGWLAQLKLRCEEPFPEELRRAIILRNHALLRGVIPAFLYQVEKAAKRGDLVSVNHRIAALLASYFDILFAVNKVLHPGEKRLIEQAERLCLSLPLGMADQVRAVLRTASLPGMGVVAEINILLDQLDLWLENKEDWFIAKV